MSLSLQFSKLSLSSSKQVSGLVMQWAWLQGWRAGRTPCAPALAASRPAAAATGFVEAVAGHGTPASGGSLVAAASPAAADERRAALLRRQASSSVRPSAPMPPPAHLQISSTASFKAPSAAAKPLQAAFRRTPLRIQAARIGGVEVPNQK